MDNQTLLPPQPLFRRRWARLAEVKYRKDIHEQDVDRSAGNYLKAAAAGSLAGLALKSMVPKGKRALIGAGAGLAAENIVRQIGNQHRDFYGDRTLASKGAEKIPAYAGLAAAGVLGYKRLKNFKPGAALKSAAKSAVGLEANDQIPMTNDKLPRRLVQFARGDRMNRLIASAYALGPSIKKQALNTPFGMVSGSGATQAAVPLWNIQHSIGAKKLLVPRGAQAAQPIAGIMRRGYRALKPFGVMKNTLMSHFPKRLVQFMNERGANDLSIQRRKLAFYAGLGLAGAGGAALLLRGGSGAPKSGIETKPKITPEGRDTLARRAKFNILRTDRGYVHLRPVSVSGKKRFAKLPQTVQSTAGKIESIARDATNISPGERKLARKAFGTFRGIHKFSRVAKLIELGGDDQYRDEKGRLVEPLGVTAGLRKAHIIRNRHLVPVENPEIGGQVFRSALRHGRTINRSVGRAHGFLRDAGDVIAGAPRRRDELGRPQKREWEKSYFKKGVDAAGTGAAIIGTAVLANRHPKQRDWVIGELSHLKDTVNRHITNFFPTRFSRVQPKTLNLDFTAPEWDVRDQRGRSARVFAPGARARVRREKEWHEEIGTQRKILGGLALAGTVGGLLAGRHLFPKEIIRTVKSKPLAEIPKVVKKVKRMTKVNVNIDGGSLVPFPVKMSARLHRLVAFDSKKKTENSGLIPALGAAALTAGGVYAAWRHPGSSAAVGGELRGARGGFTRIHLHPEQPGALKKWMTETVRPADRHIHVSSDKSFRPGRVTKGVVFDPDNTGHTISRHMVGSNDAVTRKISRGKLDEYKVASKLGLELPRTEPLGSAANLGRGWIAKPARGSQARIAISQKDILAHDPGHPDLKSYKVLRQNILKNKNSLGFDKMSVALNRHPGHRRNMVEQAILHPERFVKQKKIDIAEEYRVHTLGGKALGITSSRHSLKQVFTGSNRKAEAAAEAALKNVHPSLRNNLMAMDIAKSRRGKWHVIETNPGTDSGFLTPPGADVRGPHQLYKAVTGKYAKSTSGLAAGGAAVAAAGTADVIAKRQGNRNRKAA